jgi:hypothetical protein
VIRDVVREEDEVSEDPVVIAHVVAQESFGLEAGPFKHRSGAVLIGDDLDGQLGETGVEGL